MCTLLCRRSHTIICLYAILQLIADKLGQSPNRTVYLMTLSQDKDSVLNSDENRKLLLKVGLKCYHDVGDWLASTLESLQHNELAVKMTAFMQKKKKESKWYTPQQYTIVAMVCYVTLYTCIHTQLHRLYFFVNEFFTFSSKVVFCIIPMH